MSVLELLNAHNVRHYPVPGSPGTVITEMVRISSFGGLVEAAAKNPTPKGRVFSTIFAAKARDAMHRSLASNDGNADAPAAFLDPILANSLLSALPKDRHEQILLPTETVWTSALAGGGLELAEGYCHHAMTATASATVGRSPFVALVVEVDAPNHSVGQLGRSPGRHARRTLERSGRATLPKPLLAMAETTSEMARLFEIARADTLSFHWETTPVYVETITPDQTPPDMQSVGLRLMVRS